MQNSLLLLLLLLLSIVVVISAFFGNSLRSDFNTNLVLCNKMTDKCNVIGKFEKLSTCEDMNKRWSWFCDSVTNPDEISCSVGEGVFSYSYCEEN